MIVLRAALGLASLLFSQVTAGNAELEEGSGETCALQHTWGRGSVTAGDLENTWTKSDSRGQTSKRRSIGSGEQRGKLDEGSCAHTAPDSP